MGQHIPRLMLDESWAKGAAVTITDADRVHHLHSVMRLRAGDTVHIFNAALGEWAATITEISKKAAALSVGALLRKSTKPARAITLAFAPLKRTETEWLVEKTTELGVTTLQPIATEHTQNKVLNTERLRTIMLGAAEQCGGFAVPQLHDIKALKTFLDGWDKNIPLFAALEGERNAAPSLAAVIGSAAQLGIIIGPEGGWSDDETALLKKHAKPVALGSQILRAETAAIVACGIAVTA